MTARRFPLLAAAALAAVSMTALPRLLPAQDAGDSPTVAPEVPNAKFNFYGEINGNNVYVRSGPSDSYYPTTKLSKGTRVTVRGAKFDYLKIEPPAGSFSYVGKAYVERRGEGGKTGRVTTAANVRTGSELNSMKTTVQTKLEAGTDVQILGEQEEYFKIEPPAGAYLCVKKDYVTPGERIPTPGQGIASTQQPEGQAPQPEAPTPPADDPTGTTSAIADIATRDGSQPTDSAPAGAEEPTATGPTTGPGGTADAETAPDRQPVATRPSDSQPASAEARFEKIEAEFTAASERPVVDQPVDELMNSYQALVKDDTLPESLKRIADARIAALKVRKQTREEFVLVRKNQEEMEARRKALQAEREELEEQIRQTNVEFYAAVGMLRTSSLQQGPKGTTLYRLTDPQSGRTLVYVRTSDREFGAMLNQFVGVKGELRADPLLRMRVVTPTETKPIDSTKVGSTIAAAVLPPSLLRSTPTVSTGSEPIAE